MAALGSLLALVLGVSRTAFAMARDRHLVAVLGYYAVANASALTLERERGTRTVPVVGLAGCLVVAASLPAASVLAGVAVLAAGAAVWPVRRAKHARHGGSPTRNTRSRPS